MDWYKRYSARYDRKTLHLSLAEHGAYCRLLDYYYQTEDALPDDDKAIAAILRCSLDEWLAVSNTVRAYFSAVDGTLVQKRAETEIRNAKNRSETNRRNGKKGGRPSVNKNNDLKPNGNRPLNRHESETKPEREKEREREEYQSSTASHQSSITTITTGAQSAVDDGGYGSGMNGHDARKSDPVRDEIWKLVSILAEAGGTTDAVTRQRIGRMLKTSDPPTVLEAIHAALDYEAAAPLDYAAKIVADAKTAADMTDPAYWEKRFAEDDQRNRG